MDIPEELIRWLDRNGVENRELWTHFKQSFWPENRKATLERFAAITPEDNVYCATVFDGWMQLELMIEMLHGFIAKGKKINFHVMVAPDLHHHIKEYLEEYESELTPDTDEYDNDYKLRREFKNEMNKKLFEVIKFHNICDLERYGEKKTIRVTKTSLK
jgi:hypothetical protein